MSAPFTTARDNNGPVSFQLAYTDDRGRPCFVHIYASQHKPDRWFLYVTDGQTEGGRVALSVEMCAALGEALTACGVHEVFAHLPGDTHGN